VQLFKSVFIFLFLFLIDLNFKQKENKLCVSVLRQLQENAKRKKQKVNVI
jgi:hypothetical protein